MGSDEVHRWRQSEFITGVEGVGRPNDKLTSICTSGAKNYRSPQRRSGVDSRSDRKSVHSGSNLRHEAYVMGDRCSANEHTPTKWTTSTALCKFQSPSIARETVGSTTSDRSASGEINCPLRTQSVDERHIPQTGNLGRCGVIPKSTLSDVKCSGVGPGCPVKLYSAGVSQCWDDEAGAVYYYNHKSGEASWLPPDSL